MHGLVEAAHVDHLHPNAVIAIALTAWPPYARIARAETLTIRNADFIAAARLSGASGPRIPKYPP